MCRTEGSTRQRMCREWAHAQPHSYLKTIRMGSQVPQAVSCVCVPLPHCCRTFSDTELTWNVGPRAAATSWTSGGDIGLICA